MPKKTSKDALAEIKEKAAKGKIVFADDTRAVDLDPEIQQIFAALFTLANEGEPPEDGMLASDESLVGDILPWAEDGSGVTTEGQAYVAHVAAELGIPLSAKDRLVDAALRLRERSKRGHT